MPKHNIMDELLGNDYVDFAVNSTITRINAIRDNPPRQRLYERFDSDSSASLEYSPLTQSHIDSLNENPELVMVTVHRAIDYNNMRLLNRLLHLFRLPRPMGYEMIRISARRNNMIAIQMLVDHGYSVNRPRGSSTMVPSPVHFAMKYNNCELLHYLVNAGADINARFDGTESDYGDNSSFRKT